MRALVVLCAVAVTLCVSMPSEACKCTGPAPGPNAAKKADVVFKGEVEGFVFEHPHVKSRPTAVNFKVETVFKGQASKSVTLQMGKTSCAITWMRKGESWIVFATYNEAGELYTRQCRGSRRLAAVGKKPSKKAQAQLESLGKGRAPSADP